MARGGKRFRLEGVSGFRYVSVGVDFLLATREAEVLQEKKLLGSGEEKGEVRWCRCH